MQFEPHLHPFPPSATKLVSVPSAYVIWGATPSTITVVVVDLSMSAELQLQLLPHEQLEPQLHFPLEQDMMNDSKVNLVNTQRNSLIAG
uniref:hypothetical protein n=1 Tax=Campylobacter jejuni TaxID=197 RepID=UPI001E2847E2